ncbi:hypothetical protein [Thermophagus xiamenensis]|uniref:hypothetical protein n=1 Tax=Thermophagus xiamenensis TaxID=385682 RepID=UPI0011103046|nr:hypothetical protein [Thermophagus xiamenensis]
MPGEGRILAGSGKTSAGRPIPWQEGVNMRQEGVKERQESTIVSRSAQRADRMSYSLAGISKFGFKY